MNYFEIINATLLELNYQTVSSFEDLSKLEHKRLMNIINRLNKEICNSNDKFHFRQAIKKMSVYPNQVEYTKHFSGKINKIIGKDSIYTYEPDFSNFSLADILKILTVPTEKNFYLHLKVTM